MPGAGILGLALFLAGGLVVRTPAGVPAPVLPIQVEQIQGVAVQVQRADAAVPAMPSQPIFPKAADATLLLPMLCAEEGVQIALEGDGSVSLESLRLNQYRYPDQGAIGGFSELLTQRPAFWGEEERILGQSA